MNNYSFSDLAIQDINEICEFIAQKNIDMASKLFDRIRKKCKLVAEFPKMGKEYDWIIPNLRGFVVDDYIVFYYPRRSGIDVFRVVSGRRDLNNLFEEFGDES